MKDAMTKWLKKQGVDLNIDIARQICNSLGLDGEKLDSCLALCYQFEKGEIDQADFTGGLCVLSGKKPEEVAGILRGIKQEGVSGGSYKPGDIVIFRRIKFKLLRRVDEAELGLERIPGAPPMWELQDLRFSWAVTHAREDEFEPEKKD